MVNSDNNNKKKALIQNKMRKKIYAGRLWLLEDKMDSYILIKITRHQYWHYPQLPLYSEGVKYPLHSTQITLYTSYFTTGKKMSP